MSPKNSHPINATSQTPHSVERSRRRSSSDAQPTSHNKDPASRKEPQQSQRTVFTYLQPKYRAIASGLPQLRLLQKKGPFLVLFLDVRRADVLPAQVRPTAPTVHVHLRISLVWNAEIAFRISTYQSIIARGQG